MPRRKSPLRLPVGDDPQGFAVLIREWVDAMRARNFSEATVANRTSYLKRFMAWCLDRSLTRPAEVTRPILERYQRFLYYYRRASGAPISFRSQGLHLSALRAFFRYLTRTNHLPSNPSADLELPKAEHRIPRAVLTASEVERILVLPDVGDVYGLRDRAILEVLYCCGLRRSELVKLKLYDIDAERGTLLVRQGKGKKDRMIPIGERALAWVQKYIGEARSRLVMEPDEGYIFLTQAATPLSVSWLTDRVRDYVERSGIGKKGSCHLFRHTMATLMLEGGADIRFIQEMLGHADPKTTQIYTLVSIKKLQAVHASSHPGARLEREASPAEADTAAHEELLSSLAAEAAEEEAD
jgi:integrase/recombinase XerD